MNVFKKIEYLSKIFYLTAGYKYFRLCIPLKWHLQSNLFAPKNSLDHLVVLQKILTVSVYYDLCSSTIFVMASSMQEILMVLVLI